VHRALAYYHDHAEEMNRWERRAAALERSAVEDGAVRMGDLRDEG
jgi:hypothetical protein